MPAPLPRVTSTSTTAGRTFAITAARTVSSLFPVSGGMVATAPFPGCNCSALGSSVLLPLLPNCQPANNPTPKTMSRTSVSAIIAPVRSPREGRLGGTGGAGGSDDILPGTGIGEFCTVHWLGADEFDQGICSCVERNAAVLLLSTEGPASLSVYG